MIISDLPLKAPLEYLVEGRQVPEICELYKLSKLKFFALYKADIITFIKKLGSEGKTRKQIAKIMGISFDSVKKLKKMNENDWKELTDEQKCQIVELSKAGINTKGICSELKIPIDWVYDALKNDILLTFVQNNLDAVIKKFGMDARTITKLIEEKGLIIPNSSLALRIIEHYGEGEFPFDKPISTILKYKIIGELMGDGHLRKNRDTLNATRVITISSYKTFEEWIKLIKESTSIEIIPQLKEKYNDLVRIVENVQVTSFAMTKATKETKWNEYIETCFQKDGYKTSLRNYDVNSKLETHSSIQIQEIRDKWYKNGIKILPADFKPNPTIVLHHYEGDGSFNRNSTRISFSTHNFTKEEVYRIRDLYAKEIKIHLSVVKETKRDSEGNRYPGEYYYTLWINRNADVETFFKYLELADKDSLEMAKKVVPHKFPYHYFM